MANTLTSVIPTIFAQGLMALRQQAIMPRLVNTDYDTETAKEGQTISVPLPSAMTATNVSPSAANPSTPDITPTTASITLSQWKESAFQLSDKELKEIAAGVPNMQISEAIKALANAVDDYVLSFYTKIYGTQGTAGTTPFATVADATGARKVLANQLAPRDMNRMVVDPDAEAAALALGAFLDASASGDANVVINGNIGRKLGFDWFMDQNVPTHTAGTITTGLIAKASTAQAVGLKAIVCTTAASTGAVALLEGDIIKFAGSDQTYTLTADATEASAATDVTINVEPGLVKALAGSEAVTLTATHVVNLAFHRNCFALATRPLEAAPSGLGVITMSEVDPVSGLTLRLEVTRENKRTRYAFDILYGAQCVRPELGCRVLG